MLVMCAANVFSYYLSWERIPQILSVLLADNATNPTGFMLLITVLFLFIGMFMDGTTAMIILAPILAPVVRTLGIDMVYFGTVLVVNCAIGAITPPFGVVIYLVAPMMKMKVDDFIKELWPFIGVLIAVLLLLVLCPSIVTFLPNLIYS
jgi:TRAP-type C4-dicarboxylate transport system permease large subunit